RGLREDTGSARLTPERLPEVRERLDAALREAAGRARLSPNPERLAAGVRRLEADLERYVDAAARDGSVYEPAVLEAGIGFADEAAAQARAGALEPRPDTCTPSKSSAYPGLCRCEAS